MENKEPGLGVDDPVRGRGAVGGAVWQSGKGSWSLLDSNSGAYWSTRGKGGEEKETSAVRPAEGSS